MMPNAAPVQENNTNDFHVESLRLEHLRETLGIGTTKPRLSWRIVTEQQNWLQTAYELELFSMDNQLRETKKILSDESVLVPWCFAALHSRERVSVRVRVWSGDQVSDWSQALTLELGLLEASDWTAHFIGRKDNQNISKAQPSPLLRREFGVRPGVRQARLYITALGVYEAQINGRQVGDHVLAPGWTSYNHRLRYQTFDVTEYLLEGHNAVAAMLGDGWYRGRLGFGGGKRNIYGNQLALLAQLEIDYHDGTREQLVTDSSWRASSGAILASDIYDGETYDARLEQRGWSNAGFGASHWEDVQILECDFKTLVAPSGPPVRRTELVAPVAITTSPLGKTLVDFGQNLVGWVRLSVRGEHGQTITLRHGEVLEQRTEGEQLVIKARLPERLRGRLEQAGADVRDAVFTPVATASL